MVIYSPDSTFFENNILMPSQWQSNPEQWVKTSKLVFILRKLLMDDSLVNI